MRERGGDRVCDAKSKKSKKNNHPQAFFALKSSLCVLSRPRPPRPRPLSPSPLSLSHDVPFLGRPVVRLGVRVDEEAHLGGGVQVQDGFQLLPDAHLGCLVRGRPRPQAHLVLLGPHVDDGAADFVAVRKLFADAGQELGGKGEERGEREGGGVSFFFFLGARAWTELCVGPSPPAHSTPSHPTRTRFSHIVSRACLDAAPFDTSTVHLPPCSHSGSSHLGSTPALNRCRSEPCVSQEGGLMLLYRLRGGRGGRGGRWVVA